MRGTKAKALRSYARTVCDPTLTEQRTKRKSTTLIWPSRSFRHLLKEVKRAYLRGAHHG